MVYIHEHTHIHTRMYARTHMNTHEEWQSEKINIIRAIELF